jgi:hypothetical protein
MYNYLIDRIGDSILSVKRQRSFHTPEAVLESVDIYFHTLTCRQERPNHFSTHIHPLLDPQHVKEGGCLHAVEMYSKL